jgi:hypothetical protein
MYVLNKRIMMKLRLTEIWPYLYIRVSFNCACKCNASAVNWHYKLCNCKKIRCL